MVWGPSLKLLLGGGLRENREGYKWISEFLRKSKEPSVAEAECVRVVGEKVRGLEKEEIRQGSHKASALTWGEISSYLDGSE